MNGPVGTYRSRIAQIEEAARLHGALTDIGEDLRLSGVKEERMQRHIAELDGKVAACEQAARGLRVERACGDLADRERELQHLKDECDRTLHRYSAVSMTASHVLRKAEKIAHRQQKPGDRKAIAGAMDILSDHAVPDPSGLAAALTAAYGPARRMIDTGEGVLKNREERELFSSEEEFVGGMTGSCTRHAQDHARFVAAERAFASHPVITRLSAVEKESKVLTGALAKDRQAYADLQKWQQELKDNIPRLKEQLRKILGEITGGDVQISCPEGTPISPGG
jgi:chromosome segregation ATPase